MKCDSEVKFGVGGIFLPLKCLNVISKIGYLVSKIWSGLAVYIPRIQGTPMKRQIENNIGLTLIPIRFFLNVVLIAEKINAIQISTYRAGLTAVCFGK